MESKIGICWLISEHNIKFQVIQIYLCVIKFKLAYVLSQHCKKYESWISNGYMCAMWVGSDPFGSVSHHLTESQTFVICPFDTETDKQPKIL